MWAQRRSYPRDESATDGSTPLGNQSRQWRRQRAVQSLRLLDAGVDPLQLRQSQGVRQVRLYGIGGAHLVDQALVCLAVLQQEEDKRCQACGARLAGGQP